MSAWFKGRPMLPMLAIAFAAASFLLPISEAPAEGLERGGVAVYMTTSALLILMAMAISLAWPRARGVISLFGVHLAAVPALQGLPLLDGLGGSGFGCLVVALWLSAWFAVETLANVRTDNGLVARLINLAIPILFGIWLLILWELLTRGFGVPKVIIPSPSDIGSRFAASIPILIDDFRQTFMKAVLIGYAIGCFSGLCVAIIADRIAFLRRGLLPVGNMVSALPIIGIAPIMVMWFGFDWPSKAAVVVVMTFFPMLVNSVAGLSAAGAMERDLMNTYAADYWQTLFKLRLPAALPFIFNALKINSTLALIGAIVAEFFGTPIVGMGFRISTEIGRMNIDMVWAEIAMAALAGSAFYGLIALIERGMTFWHPSYRT